MKKKIGFSERFFVGGDEAALTEGINQINTALQELYEKYDRQDDELLLAACMDVFNKSLVDSFDPSGKKIYDGFCQALGVVRIPVPRKEADNED